MTYHAMLRAQQKVFDIMPDSKIGMEMAAAFEEAEREALVEALREARTTISIIRTQVMIEINRCDDPKDSRWEGVPDALKTRIDAIDAVLLEWRQ